MVARLKEMGATAAGCVDLNSTWGHVPFFDACTKAGIQPLLGVELCVNDEEANTPMWFLAKNEDGLKELYRAVSKAHTQRLKMRTGSIPRFYRRDVENMSEHVLRFAGAVTDGAWLHEVGAWIDLNPGSRVLNAQKQSIAAKFEINCVHTSDNSYIDEADRDLFEIISRAGLKPTPQHILPTLPTNYYREEAIAEMCAGLALPKAPMIRAEGDLEALCRAGIPGRGMEWTQEYETRLMYELGLINSKDFTSYFLVVADMCQYAKQHMLVGPSRGSAAGSLVCYLAGITEIDPIPPKLYFERFIDVSRSDLPDIDLDFPDNKRVLIFEYMAKKYGQDNTAHIGTISKYKPKSALIAVCKALGVPPQATGAVKVAMIERGIADTRANNCLEDTLRDTEPGRRFSRDYPEACVASKIEGHASHTGVHAAGLLVCNAPITDYCVVDADGIAHIEKGAAEKLGLLKIDVLGLRTLSVLEDSGINVDWYGLKFDDPKVYEVFNAKRFCGIFQFEGSAMRDVSNQMTFESLVQVDAVTALARPGPFGGGVTQEYLLRNNGKRYEPIHPLVEAQMSDTYGLPLYQEQTLAIVRHIGQFDWIETSFIRKAVSKRLGKEHFEKYWLKFREGAMRQDIPEDAARKTWDMINAMGAWQMNKAHTWSYAVISYWTAWLKAHHPLEFAASNLRNAKDDESALNVLREMVREGIEFVPFDLALSQANWSSHNGKLIGGFMNLKGFAEKSAAKFVADRDAGKLTPKQLEKIAKAPNLFSDIFPIYTQYRNFYENPGKMNVNGEVAKIEDFNGSQKGSHVFIGEMVYKNPRDINEDVYIKKRDGKVEEAPFAFLDIRVRDDTGNIGCRISRWDYERMGRTIQENVREGAHVIIRAKFVKDIRFAFITNIKVLQQ